MTSPQVTGAETTADPQIIGPAIRALRESIGLDQADLARRVDVAPSQLCRIENGTRRISPELRLRILRELGIHLAAELHRMEHLAQNVLSLIRDTQRLGVTLAAELGLQVDQTEAPR